MPDLNVNTDLLARSVREWLDVAVMYAKSGNTEKAREYLAKAFGSTELVLRFSRDDRDIDRFMSLSDEGLKQLRGLNVPEADKEEIVTVRHLGVAGNTSRRLTQKERDQIQSMYTGSKMPKTRTIAWIAETLGVSTTTVKYHLDKANL